MEKQMTVGPILIVDDDNDLCSILEAIVRKEFPVHSEHNLRCAGIYLAKVKPYIIFLDNNLPDGTGLFFIHDILLAYPDIKIVFMTADPLPGLMEKAMGEGAALFLVKPFRSTMINDIILSLSRAA